MINPATPVETLDEALDLVDFVLVMSVNPGFGGQSFIPQTLGKVQRLAAERERRRLSFRIEIDGGISAATIGLAVRAGAEVLVAGQAVFGEGDPAHNVRELLKTAAEAALQKI